MTVREIVASVTSGQISARAVVDEALSRIDAANPDLNAFIDVNPDDASARADRVDRRIAAGERLPLAGVPVAVKDNIWVAGRRVSQGSRLFARPRVSSARRPLMSGLRLPVRCDLDPAKRARFMRT